MLWIFQRTMTGPVRGAAVVGGRGPDDVDTAMDATVFDPGSAAGPEPESSVIDTEPGHAATGAPAAVARAGHGTRTKVRALFGDLNAREITVLTPLVLLIVLLGVYPQPVLDVINPTAERTMVDAGYTDPVPAIDAPLGGGQ
jgi:NADH-quinone oxidoreductase subunit M